MLVLLRFPSHLARLLNRLARSHRSLLLNVMLHFIDRKPAARGQPQIPSIRQAEQLIAQANAEGWGGHEGRTSENGPVLGFLYPVIIWRLLGVTIFGLAQQSALGPAGKFGVPHVTGSVCTEQVFEAVESTTEGWQQPR